MVFAADYFFERIAMRKISLVLFQLLFVFDVHDTHRVLFEQLLNGLTAVGDGVGVEETEFTLLHHVNAGE